MLGSTCHGSRSSVLHANPSRPRPLIYTSRIAALVAITFGTPRVGNRFGLERAIHAHNTRYACALVPTFNQTPWTSTQRALFQKSFSNFPLNTLFVTIRHCSDNAGNNKAGISRSKSVTLPVTRKGPFAQANGQLETPAVVVSSPPGDFIEPQRCNALVCLFYAQDPVKYARCHDFCTTREKNPLNQLKRHLRNHKGDVPDDILEKAIDCLNVRHTSHDNRRRRPEEKVPLPEKLAAVYRKCRQVLFGVNVVACIKLCPLPNTHIKRRRRSSNRTTDGSIDCGRLMMTRAQTTRASSQASSVTLEAHHNLVDFPTSFHTMGNDTTHQLQFRERIKIINLRLARSVENVPANQGSLDRFYSMLDLFEDQLENWESQASTNSSNYVPATAVGTRPDSLEFQVSGVAEDDNQFILQSLPQSISDSRQMYGETDIDLNNYDDQFETLQGPMWTDTYPLEDSQDSTTWQQRTFGTQSRPVHSQAEDSRRSHTPELVGEDLTSFLRPNISANTPWDSLSSQGRVCDFCQLQTSVCNGNHLLWTYND